MEEVQRMGECGDAIAIMREWEMKDEAVRWLTEIRGYVEVRDKRGGKIGSGINDDDQNGEFVLLVQVQRDFESVREACKAGKEEVVVARTLVEAEEGSDLGTVCEMLASFSYLECPRAAKSDDDDDDHLRYYYRAVGCTLSLPAKAVQEVNLSDSYTAIDQESCDDEVEGTTAANVRTKNRWTARKRRNDEVVPDVVLAGILQPQWKPCDDEVEGRTTKAVEEVMSDSYTSTSIYLESCEVEGSCHWQSVFENTSSNIFAGSEGFSIRQDFYDSGFADILQPQWMPCASFVVDTSKLAVQGPNLSLTNGAGSQTPLVRFVVNGSASADEFHLHLKLNVESLFVGVSKVEFLDTDTCLGFYPDWIRLSMEPGWQDMSVAIFDDQSIMPTESMTSTSTQNTEIGVGIGWGPAQVSARRSWGKEKTAVEDDPEPAEHIEYETEGGGVASIEWRICRWKDGKRYKSNRPLSSSLISKKLPKLPFNGAAPCFKNLRAVSWRLPLDARRQELSIKLRLLFHMQLISLTSTSPFLKSPKHLKVPLEKEFPFTIQLPTSLV